MSDTQIPPITDPLGRYWRQPDPASILVDDTHAVMESTTFSKLHEYSSSIPSGVYPGKMWKRLEGAHDPRCKPEDQKWLLCWYGECEDKRLCSINHRIVLVTGN
jgi:hypothetical protein